MNLLDYILFGGLTMAGFLFTLHKFGILAIYNVHRRKWMPEANCYFCMSFWILVSLCGIGSAFVPFLVFVPLPGATVAAFIISVIVEPSVVEVQAPPKLVKTDEPETQTEPVQ